MAIYRGIGGAGENNQDATITAVTQQATNAASSASAAAESEGLAADSALAAFNSASAAAYSEGFALAYSVNSGQSAFDANESAEDALGYASSATDSQTAAFNSATAANLSAEGAAASAASILDAETNSAASAAAALVSEGNAADSALAAFNSAEAASESESNAATSETNAAASALSASNDAATIAATYDAFDDRYLGNKTADPTTDNDGNALLTGALYYDSVSGVMKVYSGSNWEAAYASAGGALNAVNNLSDVDSIVTSRSNLGLGTAAVEDVSAFVAPNSTTTLYSLTTTDGMEVGGSLVITGDLTVNGTTTTINATNLSVTDNMIYLNSDSTVTDPDLGFAGNYNEGTYAHAGFFRDATDGYWKVFDGYTPEPNESPEINVGHASFTLADIQAANFRGALIGNATTATTLATARTIALGGDVSGSASFNGSGDVTITAVVADDSHNHNTQYYTKSESDGGYVAKDGSGNVNITGNVGIGTTSPSGALHVSGGDVYFTQDTNADVFITATPTTSSRIWFGDTDSSTAASIQYQHSSDSLKFATNSNTERMRITSAGDVGIGTTSPDGKLDIETGTANHLTLTRTGVGNYSFGVGASNLLKISNDGTERASLDSSGNFTVTGNVTAYSDERLKKDWEEVKPNFVDQLANVKSGTYTRTDSDERQAGVSAQSLQELLPETVMAGEDGMLSVAYGNAALVAVVELAKEVVALRVELNKLKGI